MAGHPAPAPAPATDPATDTVDPVPADAPSSQRKDPTRLGLPRTCRDFCGDRTGAYRTGGRPGHRRRGNPPRWRIRALLERRMRHDHVHGPLAQRTERAGRRALRRARHPLRRHGLTETAAAAVAGCGSDCTGHPGQRASRAPRAVRRVISVSSSERRRTSSRSAPFSGEPCEGQRPQVHLLGNPQRERPRTASRRFVAARCLGECLPMTPSERRRPPVDRQSHREIPVHRSAGNVVDRGHLPAPARTLRIDTFLACRSPFPVSHAKRNCR